MGTHVFTDTDKPNSAPPTLGAHLIVSGAPLPEDDGFWYSVGTSSPDEWKQAMDRPPFDADNPGPTGISLTPEFVGQTFVDQTEEKMYFSIGTNDENDWREVGSGSGSSTPVPMLARPENIKSIRRASWYSGKQKDKAVDYRYCGNPVIDIAGRSAVAADDDVGFMYVAMWRHPSFNVNTIAISTDGGQSWTPQIRENHSEAPEFPIAKHEQGLNLDRDFHMVGFGFNWAALSNDSYVTVVNGVEVHLYMDGWSSSLDRHYIVYNTRGTNTKFFLEGGAESDAHNWSAFLFEPNGTRGKYVLMVPETAATGDYFFYGSDGIAPGGTLTRYVVTPGELRTDLDAGRVPVKDSLVVTQGYTYFATADDEGDPATNPIKIWRINNASAWGAPTPGEVAPVKIWDSSTDSQYPGAPTVPWQRARRGMMIGGNDGSGTGGGDRAYFTLYNKVYAIQTNQPVVDVTPTSPNFPVMGDYVLGYDPWAEKTFFIQNSAHATDLEGPSPENGEFRDKDQVYGLGLIGVEYTSDPEEHGWMEPSAYADDIAAGAAAEGVSIAYGERMKWQQDAIGLIGHYGSADGSIQYYCRVTTRRSQGLGSVGITPHTHLKKFA